MAPASRKITLAQDDRGIAAVEFALVLPLMLMIYLGLVELSRGMRAAQKLDLVAHTLADLTAQQLTGGSNTGQAGLTEADITAVFSAATTIMSPLPTANLKMTISEVAITSPSAGVWQAKTTWTVTRNSATARPCQILTAQDATPVSFTSMPTSYTTVTNGVNPTVGPVIVADVVYNYSPGVHFEIFKWGSPPTWTMQRTSYAPVRNTYVPSHIQYFMTSGVNCQAPTP
ncbi:TadE/TadG family type IV pilus assembly protein [Methylocystis sp. ATCC 49242]|uniref:TadE/TadG family type IV pilus assembly protein n=1 Tax=Methylocystis sp. ATCC 49242 TaxID=622637 RepID=UPI0001F8681E|nr:TadE/TadG family type IV pilus assembly protein [Methylocystis sp. ATCC 49242]